MEKTINKKNRSSSDMTSGSPLKLILTFAVSVSLSSLFQNLYNLADMAIAGHALGDAALSAISSTSSLYMIVRSVSFGFNMGTALILARFFGAGSKENAKKAYSAMLSLSMALTILLTVCALCFLKPLLNLLNVPEAILKDATTYIAIILAGLIVPMMNNLYANLMKAMGNSRTPLFFQIVSAFLNVGMDLLFVAVFKWGVAGAAIATLASEALCVVISIVYVKKNYPELQLKGRDFIPDRKIVGDMLPTGLSVALSHSLFSIGSLAVQGTVNGLGEASIIGHASGDKLLSFACIPSGGLFSAVSTFTAQNYGAGKYERIPKAIKLSGICSAICSIPFIILAYTCGGFFVELVTGTTNLTAIEYGALTLRIGVPCIVIQTLLVGTRMAIQGMGHKIAPLIATGIELVIRCFCAWFLSARWGFTGIACAQPLGWITSGIYVLVAFAVFYKKLRSQTVEEI